MFYDRTFFNSNKTDYFYFKDIKTEKNDQNQRMEKELSAREECEKEIAHKDRVLANLEEQIHQLNAKLDGSVDMQRRDLELEELKKEIQVCFKMNLYITV